MRREDPFVAIAEQYARGLLKPEYPPDDVPVSYSWRLYPEYATDRNQVPDPDPPQPPDLPPGVWVEGYDIGPLYGWTVCMHYINAETNEEIHRFEITRPTKREVVAALRKDAPQIKNARQRKRLKQWLKLNKDGLDAIARSDK